MPYGAGSNIHVRAPKEKMVPVCRRQYPGNWENQPLSDSPWLGLCFGVITAALPSGPQNRRSLCLDEGKRWVVSYRKADCICRPSSQFLASHCDRSNPRAAGKQLKQGNLQVERTKARMEPEVLCQHGGRAAGDF